MALGLIHRKRNFDWNGCNMKLFYMFSGESKRNCLQQTHGCSSFFQVHSISFFPSCLFFHLFFFFMHISLSSFPFLFNISPSTSFHSFLNSLYVKFLLCILFSLLLSFQIGHFFLADIDQTSFWHKAIIMKHLFIINHMEYYCCMRPVRPTVLTGQL